MTAWHHAVYC